MILVQLEKLSLANNEQLGGPIPTTIEKLTSLQKLDVSYTRMSGVLPAEVFLLGSNLTALNLAHCQFTGPLPNDLAQLVSLKSLNVEGNDFSGSIPVEALAALETLGTYFAHNERRLLGECMMRIIIDVELCF